MTVIDHLNAAADVRGREAEKEGKLYADLIQEKQKNAMLRSEIDKLKRVIDQMTIQIKLLVP